MSQNSNNPTLSAQPARNLLVKIAQELHENWSSTSETDATAVKPTAKRLVLNGTGRLLHPQLGRAPLGPIVYENLKSVVLGYCDWDVDNSPTAYLNSLFDTIVPEYKPVWTNNNVSALLLCLSTLRKNTGQKRVIVSRGDLTELAGGLRIQDLIGDAGLEILEVGSSNITRLKDYEDPVKNGGGIVLKVIPTQFAMEGVYQSASPQELSFMARKWEMPFVLNAGSLTIEQLKKSPSSVTMITCSTDKALGSVQGGLILAQPDLQKTLLSNPLYRSMRLDKLRVSALETTLSQYVEKKDKTTIPYAAMASATLESLKARAKTFETLTLKNIVVKATTCPAYRGEGPLASQQMESAGLLVSKKNQKDASLKEAMNKTNPPILTAEKAEGTQNDSIINLITILPSQDSDLENALLQLDASLG